jgi:predicted metal-dependent phosphoesterase TrpH
MPFCDLHIHSIFSDGTYTIDQIIDIAQQKELVAISVTDHDTVEGVPGIKVLGSEQDITVLSGVELSGVFKEREIHILGYLFDEHDTHLRKELREMREHRETRAQKIVEKLVEHGCDITIDDVKEVAAGGAIGRPHIARALLEHKCILQYKDAFTRYIGNGKPCNVPKYRLHPKEAIQLIENAGGIAVLAHPGNIGDEVVVRELLSFPFRGIEVWHPDHSSSSTALYIRFAEERGLLLTGGSDSHGEKGTKAPIGGIRVDAEVVNALIEHKKTYL